MTTAGATLVVEVNDGYAPRCLRADTVGLCRVLVAC
jgi:hypothetical protein